MKTFTRNSRNFIAIALLAAAFAVGCGGDSHGGENEQYAGGGGPNSCPPVWVECTDGSEPIDSDGDGCAAECQAPAPPDQVDCPPVWVECADGAEPIDTHGDGCALECPNEATSNT